MVNFQESRELILTRGIDHVLNISPSQDGSPLRRPQTAMSHEA